VSALKVLSFEDRSMSLAYFFGELIALKPYVIAFLNYGHFVDSTVEWSKAIYGEKDPIVF
jgi:hypothetical protein